jgi:hypothetical protein
LSNPKFACPECGKQYNDAAHVGIHRRAAHGVKGKSRNAIKRRNSIGLPPAAPVESTPAKRKYTKRSTNLETIPQSHIHSLNGNEQPRPQTRPFHAEAALAVAFGRFKELCTSIAVEYDLPPRSFAARLAELIHAEALR